MYNSCLVVTGGNALVIRYTCRRWVYSIIDLNPVQESDVACGSNLARALASWRHASAVALTNTFVTAVAPMCLRRPPVNMIGTVHKLFEPNSHTTASLYPLPALVYQCLIFLTSRKPSDAGNIVCNHRKAFSTYRKQQKSLPHQNAWGWWGRRALHNVSPWTGGVWGVR